MHEAAAPVLSAARDRRARAAARAAGPARAHDPFRAAAHREGHRQGAGARPRRSTWCSAISRTRSRPTPRRRRATASSPWRKATDFGATGLWTRINALNSPWALDDITEIVAAVGNKLDVIMLPKVEGAWDIHYLDQLLAQLEARHAVKQADPDPRHPGDRAGRQQCRGDRRRLAAHARHEPRPRRSRRLARA